MKKIFGIVTIVILAIVLVGCGKDESQKPEKDYSQFTYLPTLTHDQFKAKLATGEEFYVYIGRYDCGDSVRFHEEFENLFVDLDQDGNVVDVFYELDEKNFYYFDISEIIDSTSNTETRLDYKDDYGFYFTPSLVSYKDGEVQNIAEWSSIYGFSISDYMKWFYDNGLITPNEKVYHEGESIKTRD